MAKKLMKDVDALVLAEALGLEIQGEQHHCISMVVSLDESVESSLSFSKGTSEEFSPGVLIAPKGANAATVIISENPRLDFCRALLFLTENEFISTSSFDGNVADSAHVSEHAVIEKGVVIGENTVIEHNVVVHSGTTIGSNSIIRSGTVLGAQGFGFEKDENGVWQRFTHLGGLKIGDNVEIGALNSICVGALDDTVICDGVKTDNLVHVAHNCKIGKNTIITACAELSGGVTIGEGVWIGPNSSTMQKILIGDNALVGVGSVVTKNVKPNYVVAGNPAKVIKKG